MILYHFVLVNVTLVSTLSAVLSCAAEHVKGRFWNVILGNINYYIINSLNLILMPQYDLHKKMRPSMRRLAISIFILTACHQIWFPIKSDLTISGKQSGRAHVNIFQGKVLQYFSQLKGNGARRRFYFREIYFWHDTFSGSANTGAGSGVNSARAARAAPKAHEGNTLINLSKESTGIALSAADLETITANGILRSPCHINWTEHQYKCCDWEEGKGRAKPASTEYLLTCKLDVWTVSLISFTLVILQLLILPHHYVQKEK